MEQVENKQLTSKKEEAAQETLEHKAKVSRERDCSVVLPRLTSDIFSTVSLVANPFAPSKMEEEEEDKQKRPIFLGHLVIGYESVTPAKRTRSQTLKPESKTKQRIAKRKARERMASFCAEPDLTPVIIPQNVVVVRDHNGKKRRLDLKKLAETEQEFQEEEDQTWKRIRCLKEEIVEGGDEWSDDEVQILDGGSDESLEAATKLVNTETKEAETKPEESEDEVQIEFESRLAQNSFDAIASPNNKPAMNYVQPLTPESLTLSPERNFETSKEKEDDDPDILLLDTPSPGGNTSLMATQNMQVVTPMDVCNICGSVISSRKKASTYLKINENNLKYYLCLTCNQRFSLIELTRHKTSCFLTEDEFFGETWGEPMPGWGTRKELKLRMVACDACCEYVDKL